MRSFSIPGWNIFHSWLFLPIFLDEGSLEPLFARAPKVSGWVVAPFVSHLWLSLPSGEDFTKPVSPKIQVSAPSLSQGLLLEVSPEEVAPCAPVPSRTLVAFGAGQGLPPRVPPGNSGSPVTSPHPIPCPKGNGHTFMRKVWPFPNVRQKPGGLWLL